MEFNEKLQQLRKQKGLTQEELAQQLYVSRTAVSKWESGRGYPGIDSLKAIARFFSVTVDELLSGEEILTIAEEDGRAKENRIRDLGYAMLDCGFALLLFLPFFGQQANGILQSVSLLELTEISVWLKVLYFIFVVAVMLMGAAGLALISSACALWNRIKHTLSLSCGTAAVFLFIVSRQPYAAAFALVFLVIKALMLLKRP